MRLTLCLALVLAVCKIDAAYPSAWPDKILRGANLGIFPGSPGHYSEQDIAHFALNWRGNSVRILINNIIPDSAPYQVSQQTREDVFRLIDLCLKYRLYTVFAFSASFDNNDAFFTNEQLKAAYSDFWKEVAVRYAASEGIAYDLMNEPHDDLAESQWSGYAKELTGAIRQIDSVHTIIVEPPGWGWPDGFDHLEPTGDENTVYSFHFYGPMDFTHQRSGGRHMSTTESQWKQRAYPGLIVSEWGSEYWDKEIMRPYVQKAVQFRDRHNVKLWCGEFGVARWALGAEQWMKDWIDLLEEENIGWSYYSYREWHHMDLEMDPQERVNPTGRSETTLVKLVKGYFSINEVPVDFNLDGSLNVLDVIDLLKFQHTNPGSLAADYNKDGKSNITDALCLLIDWLRGK
jgi:endoglucanase